MKLQRIAWSPELCGRMPHCRRKGQGRGSTAGCTRLDLSVGLLTETSFSGLTDLLPLEGSRELLPLLNKGSSSFCLFSPLSFLSCCLPDSEAHRSEPTAVVPRSADVCKLVTCQSECRGLKTHRAQSKRNEEVKGSSYFLFEA